MGGENGGEPVVRMQNKSINLINNNKRKYDKQQ